MPPKKHGRTRSTSTSKAKNKRTSSSSTSRMSRRTDNTNNNNNDNNFSTTTTTLSESVRLSRSAIAAAAAHGQAELDHHHHHHDTSQQRRGRLLFWEEVPTWLQYNRFVRTGYRHMMSPLNAVKSILRWHNETVNIWTHFLPAFFFLFALAEECYNCWVVRGTAVRPLYLLSAVGCIFVCMVSTAYHSLMCCSRSAKEYQDLLCIDILGSVVVISSTAVSILSFGNPCLPTYTRAWMLALFGASTIATVVVIVSGSMSAARRAMLFGMHLLLRLGMQFSVLMPKYRATGTHGSMTLHGTSFLFLALGGMVNVSRIPERFFTQVVVVPAHDGEDDDEVDHHHHHHHQHHHGHHHQQPRQVVIVRRPQWIASMLDYFGNSHNIWHVLSIYSCYLTFKGVAVDYEEFDHLHGKVECHTWR